jgi:probable F420-dependent oxidoreductase
MNIMTKIGKYGVWASHLGLLPAETARRSAQRMEELGFSALWVGEAEGKEALAHAAFLLAATDHIQIATGIANIWARDARTMFNGARTLAEGFDQRFILGIGASHAPLVEDRGRSYGKPYTEMVRYLDAMAKSPWRGPDLPDEPPLVLAALGPKMLRLAAERSDGAHTFLVPVEHTRQAREALGGALLAPEQAFAIADTREDARRAADRHLRNYLRLPNYRRNLERLGYGDEDMGDPTSDRLFDALIAWGDPAKVAERIREQVAAGADHVAIHPLTPTPEEGPVPSLEALAPELTLHDV